MQKNIAGYVALDLDGTLVDSSGIPMENSIAALQRLHESGFVPILVSGRSYLSFSKMRGIDELLDHLHSWVLLSDGNVTVSRTSKRALVLNSLDTHLVSMCARNIPEFVAEVADRAFATSDRAAALYALAYKFPRSLVEVIDGPGWRAQPVTAICVFDPTIDIRSDLGGGNYDIHRIRPFKGRVVRPAGSCKALALKRFLLENFGVESSSNVFSFGDGYNDACLLSSSRIGYSVCGSDHSARRFGTISLSGSFGSYICNGGFYNDVSLSLKWNERSALDCVGVHKLES